MADPPDSNDVATMLNETFYSWWPIDTALDLDRSRIEWFAVGAMTIDGTEFDIANRPRRPPQPGQPAATPVLRLSHTARRGWQRITARRKAKTPARLRLILEQEAIAQHR